MQNLAIMNKTIVHIIGNLCGGGKERRMVQCVKGLASSGEYYQHIILLEDRIDYQEVYGIKNVSITILKSGSKYDVFIQMRRFLAEVKADIVHSWIDSSLFLLIIPMLKARFRFCYIAGYIGDSIRIPMLSYYNFLSQFTYFFADRIISNSYAGLKAKRSIKSKSIVIYNGFDYGRFDTEIDIRTLKDSLGLGHTKLVVMIGRLFPAKDFDSFIAVAELAEKENLNVTFLAIGGGPLLDYYNDAIRKKHLSNIRFLGRRSDVEKILQITYVSILFSNNDVHAEGVSNAIMESMAAGVPVIATEGGGTAEIITSKISGFIVTPKNVIDAFNCLKQLLSSTDLYTKMSKASKEVINQRFLLNTMTNDYIKLYKQTLK